MSAPVSLRPLMWPKNIAVSNLHHSNRYRAFPTDALACDSIAPKKNEEFFPFPMKPVNAICSISTRSDTGLLPIIEGTLLILRRVQFLYSFVLFGSSTIRVKVRKSIHNRLNEPEMRK